MAPSHAPLPEPAASEPTGPQWQHTGHPAWCSAAHCQLHGTGDREHRSDPIIYRTVACDTEITVQRYQYGDEACEAFRVGLMDLDLHGREMTLEITRDDTAMIRSMFGMLGDAHRR